MLNRISKVLFPFPFLFILFISMSITSYAQITVPSGKPTTNIGFAFKLYPTNNVWTFIKLDTRNGKMWQVQYSIKGSDYRFESALSELDLTSVADDDAVNGRFELYPTQNNYNFILLDRVKGTTYQVQWSIDEENRGIWLIGVNGDTFELGNS